MPDIESYQTEPKNQVNRIGKLKDIFHLLSKIVVPIYLQGFMIRLPGLAGTSKTELAESWSKDRLSLILSVSLSHRVNFGHKQLDWVISAAISLDKNFTLLESIFGQQNALRYLERI